MPRIRLVVISIILALLLVLQPIAEAQKAQAQEVLPAPAVVAVGVAACRVGCIPAGRAAIGLGPKGARVVGKVWKGFKGLFGGSKVRNTASVTKVAKQTSSQKSVTNKILMGSATGTLGNLAFDSAIGTKAAGGNKPQKQSGKKTTKTKTKTVKPKARNTAVVSSTALSTTVVSGASATGTKNPREVDPKVADYVPMNGNIKIITYVDKERVDREGNRDARIGNVNVKVERVDGQDSDCSNRNKQTGKTNAMRYHPKDKSILVKGTINWRGCSIGKYKATLIGRSGYDNVGQTTKEFTLSDDEVQVVKFLVKKAGDPEPVVES